ncbi:MAG TPA: glutamate--tRNA ligase [Methanoregulaceae archaeon]|nr:glutamate--tRNA ligase [Methanoregulaceae archaeon]
MEEIRQALFVCALQNSVKHRSLPKSGTVMGMVMGTHPEFRSRSKEVSSLLKEVLKEVALLTPDERQQKLIELAPDMVKDLSRPKVRRTGLPSLQGADEGVVMRFAPNPSGPLHLGHARAAVLNDEYVKRYGGKYILRIEDTDPKRIDPDAYGMVAEDIEWLGLTIHEIVYQSDRFDLYYRLGGELIAMGGAYVCTCENEQFRELKLARKACPCRDEDVDTNLELWQKMLDGEFYEGSASVRVKTDLDHPDPAMRDYPVFRILKSPPHPRLDACVYPLMNFSVAVDDHMLGVTHVIRGKDHIANTRRQKYIFDYFGWEIPQYRHYGRMGIEGLILSTSQIREGISAGRYEGWDDIRLGTLRALARRGIEAQAVREAMLDIGIGETDISFSWENLYAKNKNIVDPVANRYFFVPDPVEVRIADAPDMIAHALLHPGEPKRGIRKLSFSGLALVPGNELQDAVEMVRLKDLFNVKVEWGGGSFRCVYTGDSLADARAAGAPIIQWLPSEWAVRCTLITPDGRKMGVCEPAVAAEIGNVIQFERIGFARIDASSPEGIIAYFTHK